MKDNTKEKMLLVECSRVFQYHYKQYIIPLFLYNMEGGREKTALFKNTSQIRTSVQPSTAVPSDCTFKCAGNKSIISR